MRSVFVDIRELLFFNIIIIIFGHMKSKRMMNDKQDQYREYVVSKLLCKTHIQWVDTGTKLEDDTSFRQLVINGPFNQQLFLLHSPEHKVPLLTPFEIIPLEFYDLMEEYAITGDEVKVIWELYSKMVYKMIDGKHCDVTDTKSENREEWLKQKTL